MILKDFYLSRGCCFDAFCASDVDCLMQRCWLLRVFDLLCASDVLLIDNVVFLVMIKAH